MENIVRQIQFRFMGNLKLHMFFFTLLVDWYKKLSCKVKYSGELPRFWWQFSFLYFEVSLDHCDILLLDYFCDYVIF